LELLSERLEMKKVVIVESKRSPIGSFLGALSSLSAPKLASLVIKDILNKTRIDPYLINEVILGNVLSAGLGQAPARQAAIMSGLPVKIQCLTINKMCGSGLKAVMLAQQSIICGDADIIIAGGMESMSNTPYLLPNARKGYRLGHSQIIDSMICDGLWDVYNDIHMGSCAEECARTFGMSREEVDNYAIGSYQKALKAQKELKFNNEITPIILDSKQGSVVIAEDEEPSKVNFSKIPTLKPSFENNGIVTVANASKLNDGAAALLIMCEEAALKYGFQPQVEIIAQSSSAKAPIEFPSAPAESINKVLSKANLALKDIDLFEINEAFAVVAIAAKRILEIDNDKLNINGGAIALGHPIGASGARILVTLIHELKRQSLNYGLASICIGGGEASSLIIKNYL
jgi:acetyl-CoA C-acetyltransferase